MPFKDALEGQTHYQNDGCGELAHNPMQDDFNEEARTIADQAHLLICKSDTCSELCNPGADAKVQGMIVSVLYSLSEKHEKEIEELREAIKYKGKPAEIVMNPKPSYGEQREWRNGSIAGRVIALNAFDACRAAQRGKGKV